MKIKTIRVRLREWKRDEKINTNMTQLIQMLIDLTVWELWTFWGIVVRYPDRAEAYLIRHSRG